MTQALQDVLDGHALLLTVDDVGFREHAATPRQARHALRARHQVRVAVKRQAQALHLVLEEAAGACRATFVHGELRRRTRRETGGEHAGLRAHLHDACRLRGQRAHAFDQGGNLFELAKPRSQRAHHARTAARDRHAAARAKRQRPRRGGSCGRLVFASAFASSATARLRRNARAGFVFPVRQLIKQRPQARQR